MISLTCSVEYHVIRNHHFLNGMPFMCRVIAYWNNIMKKWSYRRCNPGFNAMGIPLSPTASPMSSFHFYPRPVLAFRYCRCLRLCVCLSVCLCINHLLVHAITRDPFKLGSPNLDQRYKRPWLRSLLFWGAKVKVKFNFKVRIHPILSLSGLYLITNSS